MSRPVAIELFSGCGGLSTGLLDAGYDVRLGVDNNASSLITFDHNHRYRGAKSLLADISQVSGAELLTVAEVSQVDLLAGGPPCQPFSIAGKRLGLEDPRGHLVQEFVRVAGELRPSAVLFENVPALLTSHNGDVIRALESELVELGYAVAYKVLNSADYGVPQNRKRLILVGVLGGKALSFPPAPTHSPGGDLIREPYVTVRDVLDALPPVESTEANLIPNHEPTAHSASMLRAFSVLEVGKRDPKSRHDRLHPDRPGYTIRAGSGNYSPMRPVHYEYDRVVSVRESARIQGFSDKFVWPDSVSRLQQYRQVGNAVPPPLANAVGRHVADFMGWSLDAAESAGHVEERPEGILLTAEERRTRRMKYHRGGASFGRVVLEDQPVPRHTEATDARASLTDFQN
jgi:DNA (cytosine-5)-methyltransferase 1